MRYNPIARNFYRIRQALIDALKLPRNAIRPTATFAELVPRNRKRQVYERLLQDKICFHRMNWPHKYAVVLILTALISWIVVGSLLAINGWLILLSVIFFVAMLAWWLSLREVANWSFIDVSNTLGEAALEITSAEECKDAHYRLTSNEIMIKVRMILAQCGNIKLQKVTPEKSLQKDLGFE